MTAFLVKSKFSLRFQFAFLTDSFILLLTILQTNCMSGCVYRLCCFTAFCLCIGLKLSAQQASYKWFAGVWKQYSIQPDTVKGKRIESELNIDTIINNHFNSTQKLWCVNDTLAQIKLAGNGFFNKADIHYENEGQTYRKESPDSTWNTYANYPVDTTYFSIRAEKLLLHIQGKKDPKNSINSFVYYRNLTALPFSLRRQFQKLYNSPQLVNDSAPVVNHNFTDSIIADLSLPSEIINRKNTLVKTLDVTSPDIQIVLLDDAEIDGDIISLYHNNELVLNHKTIGKEMVKFALKANAEHPHHEFILVAENLGGIPPNTALVRIRAGEVKYEFVAHSDMHENAKFIISYIGNNKIGVMAPHK